MAYKETFANSLNMIPEALKWAERQDIKQLRDFTSYFTDFSKKRCTFATEVRSASNIDTCHVESLI